MKAFCKMLNIICMSPIERVFSNFPVESPSLQSELKAKRKKGQLLQVHRKMKEIRRRDLSMIDHSNFVIIVLDTTRPTYGTIEELVVAEKSNKPVFIVVKPNLKHIPLWLLGMFKPNCFYRSLSHVKDALLSLDSGESKLEKKHWKIFDKKYIPMKP